MTGDDEILQSRLSRIETIWTMLADAQAVSLRGSSKLALIERYRGAAYRYLLGATRNADAADEVFQEFAVRVLQGAFEKANPEKGRFRDYLKTTLYHLVADYQNRQRRIPKQLDTAVVQPEAPPADEAESDRRFLQSWCEELLSRAWADLSEAQRQGGQPYFSVLKFRAAHPEATSTAMAEQLNALLKPTSPYTDTALRKVLQRARAHFADVLLEEVERSLGEPTIDALEQELIDLDLLAYCRSALARRREAERAERG